MLSIPDFQRRNQKKQVLKAQNVASVSYGPKQAPKRPKLPETDILGNFYDSKDPGRCFLYPIFNVETRKTGLESSKCSLGELRSKTGPKSLKFPQIKHVWA